MLKHIKICIHCGNTFETNSKYVIECPFCFERRNKSKVGEYLRMLDDVGWSEIIDYGPHLPDFDLLHPNFQIKYSRIEYNQGKLERTIDKFLNDPKRLISQARVVELSDVADIEFINPVYKVFPKNEVSGNE